MKKLHYFFVLVMFCMTSIPAMLHAAGAIPRDALRLELLLATGAQDTSGNNRPITATGIAPTYQVDPLYGIPYAQFSGSGGLRVNTAWTAGAADDFSVSMWVKQGTGSFLGGTGSKISTPQKIDNVAYQPFSYWSVRNIKQRTILSTYIAQPLFISASGSVQDSKLRLLIAPDGKCVIKGASPTSTINFVESYQAITDSYGTYNADYLNEQLISNPANNMRNSFNCSKMLDNRWHHIMLIRQAGNIAMLVDGLEVLKISGQIELSRDILFGYSDLFNPDNYSSPVYSTWDIFTPNTYSGTISFSGDLLNKIQRNHYSRSAMAGVRIYSRALSADEIEALGDEYRYAQSDLIGAGNISLVMDKYTKPNLTIQIKSIPLNLSKDIVEYQYSTDGKTFSGITSLSDISTSTGSITYRASMDLSSIPDGKVNLTLRVRASNNSYQNIGTISFSKIDIQASININQPDVSNAFSKTITASASGTQMLSFVIQRGSTVCDGTIATWEDYSDLTFGSTNDNNVRVCYRAVYPNIGKTIYKLSDPIQGIVANASLVGSNSYSLFKNYQKWNSSYLPNNNDTTSMTLELLNLAKQRSDSYAPSGGPAGYSLSSGNPITMTDINGDGLVDFLYHTTDPVRRAIVVNNGNYTFKVVYKCAIDIVNGNQLYYGDCADTTR